MTKQSNAMIMAKQSTKAIRKVLDMLVVQDEEDSLMAQEWVVEWTRLKKDIKARYEEDLKPLRETKKGIEAERRVELEPFDVGIGVVKGLIKDYNKRLKTKRLQAASDLEASLDDTPEQMLDLMAEATNVPAKADGISYARVWKVEIEDINQVPIEFLKPDMPAIRKRVRATKGEPIPGVKITREEEVRTRT